MDYLPSDLTHEPEYHYIPSNPRPPMKPDQIEVLGYHEKWEEGFLDKAMRAKDETKEAQPSERSSREGSISTDTSRSSSTTNINSSPSSTPRNVSTPSASQLHGHNSADQPDSPQPAHTPHRHRRDSVLSTTSSRPAQRTPPSSSSSASGFECCGQRYVNRRTLRRHQRESRNCPHRFRFDLRPRFRCRVCPKTFKRKFSVKQHLTEVHGCTKSDAKETMKTWFPEQSTPIVE